MSASNEARHAFAEGILAKYSLPLLSARDPFDLPVVRTLEREAESNQQHMTRLAQGVRFDTVDVTTRDVPAAEAPRLRQLSREALPMAQLMLSYDPTLPRRGIVDAMRVSYDATSSMTVQEAAHGIASAVAWQLSSGRVRVQRSAAPLSVQQRSKQRIQRDRTDDANLRRLLEEMEQEAADEAIAGMDRANDPLADVQYGGQPGGPGKEGKLNAEFWEHLGDYDFRLKKRKSASKGIDAIFQGPTLLECNTMMIAIEYRAIRAAIGQKRFDKGFGEEGHTNQRVRIRIGAARQKDILGDYLEEIRHPEVGKLERGDWVYFENHGDYLYKHPAGAWQGENAIYLGKNDQGEPLFSGFGVSSVTEDEMLLELRKAYNQPRSPEDEARALKLREPDDVRRLKWLEENRVIVAPTEDEAITMAENGLELPLSHFNYDIIEETASSVTIYLDYVPPEEQFLDQVTLQDLPGLTQCLRLDMEKVHQLHPDESPAETAG